MRRCRYPCWSPKEAGHDPRRPLRDQRRHRCGSGRRRRQELPRGPHYHDLQPCELHRAHCRGGPQEARSVQPQEALRGHHPGRRPRQDLLRREERPGREHRGRARRWRSRRHHHPPSVLSGHPLGPDGPGDHRGAHRQDAERRHRGRRGQGGQGKRHPLHGLCRSPVRGRRPQGSQRRAGRRRVHLRREQRDGRSFLLQQGQARPRGSERDLRARGPDRLREGLSGQDDAGASGLHRQGG
mmetsp:Transcript_7164/g.24628  ORF Transcript_7164/g.24628 Transcript_7164/m.24628 type:complete len:240 (-) Transcript_7164:79-798(-)